MSEVLLQAVRLNQLEEVRQLIEEGADVNYRNAQGITALMIASKNLSIPMMTQLLEEHGAKIDIEDTRAQTALNHIYIECTNDNENEVLSAINLLLKYDADAKHLDASHNTLLQWAALKGFCKIGKRMLEAGCDPNSALLDAYAGGKQDMINLILADPRTADQQTVFDLEGSGNSFFEFHA